MNKKFFQTNHGFFPIQKLLPCYDAVAVCSGAGDIQRKLSIKGEDLPHVYSSLEITGYYNEHPHYLENYFERKNKPIPNFKSAKKHSSHRYWQRGTRCGPHLRNEY